MNFSRMNRTARACLARQARTGLHRRYIKAEFTINSIAAPAIFYWSKDLNRLRNEAAIDSDRETAA